MQKFLLLVLLLLIFFASPNVSFAGPSSTHYTLQQYGFGAGGTASSSSTNFSMFGTAGQVEQASASSNSFSIGAGLVPTLQAHVPPAPSFTNPGNAYNKLQLVINVGSNPSDSTYALSVSTDSFVSDIRYVQADGTLSVLPIWQSYSTWRGASGMPIIGLKANTTYSARVAAMQGTFTQSAFGPYSSASTINPSMTFAVVTGKQNNPPFTIGFGNSIQANTITSSDDSMNVTFSTNAVFGGNVYMYGTNSGLKSLHAGHTISSLSGDLASPAEGEGAQISATSQLIGVSPYNVTGTNVGIVDSTIRQVFTVSAPVTSATGSIILKAKTQTTTPAANDYTEVVNLIAAALF